MKKILVDEIDVFGKKVIVRVDFNVPLKEGVVESDKRLRAALQTITHLQKAGARIILMSHLGRPKGKVVEEMKMEPVAKRLSELLGTEIVYVNDCIGAAVEAAVANLNNGDILLLENLRFYSEETANDVEFSRKLASLADVYVNDAFGAVHRAHASTEGITHHLEERACGYLIQKELEFLGGAVDNPKRPFVAIMGGAKISGKIAVIEALLPKVDKLLIGGGMAYTFYKAKGFEIGNSLCEEDKVSLAKTLLDIAGDKLELPIDCRVTNHLDFKNRTIDGVEIVADNGISVNQEACDIGPKTEEKYAAIIHQAKTVVWNGPMGVFEIEEMSQGTHAIAKSLSECTKRGGISIIGGGDSAAAIEQFGLESQVSHVSTGGGASLKFLEGKTLPGVDALPDK